MMIMQSNCPADVLFSGVKILLGMGFISFMAVELLPNRQTYVVCRRGPVVSPKDSVYCGFIYWLDMRVTIKMGYKNFQTSLL
jgi:hypothetical protein